MLNIILIYNSQLISKLLNIIDYPNSPRKIHSKNTPLLGGVIIYANILFFFICSFFFNINLINENIFFKDQKQLFIFFISATLIFSVGIYDDKNNLNPYIKFLLLLLIFFLLINFDNNINIEIIKFSFSNKEINLFNYSNFFTIFCFMLFLNACNMFDGINLQLTSYMLLILISFLYLIFYLDGFILFIIFPLLAIAILNANGKIFLGDSGALLISFISGYITIRLYNLNYFKFSDSVFIFMMVPGFDMLRLFVERLFNKKNPFQADRNHIHHIILSVYSYKKTQIIIFLLLIFPILMFFLKLSNLFIIILSLIFYLFILFFFRLKIKKQK